MEIKKIEMAIVSASASIGKTFMERIFVMLVALLFLVSAYCGYMFYEHAVKIDDVSLVVEAKVETIEEEKLNAVISVLDDKEGVGAGREISVKRDIFR